MRVLKTNKCRLTSTFPQVVKAVKTNKNPKPKITTLKVLLSAMAFALHVYYRRYNTVLTHLATEPLKTHMRID